MGHLANEALKLIWERALYGDELSRWAEAQPDLNLRNNDEEREEFKQHELAELEREQAQGQAELVEAQANVAEEAEDLHAEPANVGTEKEKEAEDLRAELAKV